MTHSALEEVRSSDMLGRNFELYRDLSMALQDQITRLKAGTDLAVTDDKAGKDAVEALKAHHRSLQSVLDLEASLVKRSRSTDGGGVELDLGAARAEILARLQRWGEGG